MHGQTPHTKNSPVLARVCLPLRVLCRGFPIAFARFSSRLARNLVKNLIIMEHKKFVLLRLKNKTNWQTSTLASRMYAVSTAYYVIGGGAALSRESDWPVCTRSTAYYVIGVGLRSRANLIGPATAYYVIEQLY